MKCFKFLLVLALLFLIFTGCKSSSVPEVESWNVAKAFLSDPAKATETYKDKELVFRNIAVWTVLPDEKEVDGLAFDPATNTIADNSESTVNGKKVNTSDTFIVYALLSDATGIDKLSDPQIEQIENKQIRHYKNVINIQGTFDRVDSYSIYIKNAKIVK